MGSAMASFGGGMASRGAMRSSARLGRLLALALVLAASFSSGVTVEEHAEVTELHDMLSSSEGEVRTLGEDPAESDDDEEKEEKTEVAAKDGAASAGGAAGSGEAPDPAQLQLLECTKKADAEESNRLKVQLAAEECSRKLQAAQVKITQATQRAKQDDELRSKAVTETKHALEEEKKAVKLAETQKEARLKVKEQCEAEIKALKEANDAAILQAKTLAEKTKSQVADAEQAVKSKAEAEEQRIIKKATDDRKAAVADIETQRDQKIKLAGDQKDATIKAARAEAAEKLTKLKEEKMLELQNAKNSAEDAIRKAKLERDAAVKKSEDERDVAQKALLTLEGQVEVAEKEANLAEGSRKKAVEEYDKYRKWAQEELAKAKDKVQKSMTIAQSAAQIQGSEATEDNISSTIKAANSVAEKVEAQVASSSVSAGSTNSSKLKL